MRLLPVLMLMLLVCPPASPGEADDIIRRSCERDSQNLELRRQYTWRQTTHIRRQKRGEWKTERLRTFEVLYLDGAEYRRLVEKDGHPVLEEEFRDEQAKLEREIRKRRSESASERRKRQEKDARELDEEKKVRRELPEAYVWTLLGEEAVNGRACWKLQAEPRSGYQPNLKQARIFPKLHGVVWVDQQTYEWAKVEAESIDAITAGLGMLRVGKGFRFVLEQQFVNGELWAPVSIRARANARALFIGGNFDVDVSFKDYRKYSVSSTVSAVGESNF